MFLPIFLIVLLAGHALLIETYRRWFKQIKPFNPLPQSSHAATFFSVIVPARNEEDRIASCLASILEQHYPANLFEVIVADDHSTDDTAGIVSRFKNNHGNVKLLRLADLLEGKQLNSYKKKAIELAISCARGNWIVTTDADCKVPERWLANLDLLIRDTEAVFVAAPVKFTNSGTFVSLFQCLDFMSLQGITAAAVNKGFHSMCNGANLAYSKQAFYAVGGFKGIDNIASGDDMMLMHKVYQKWPSAVKYLFAPTSIVETPPMPSWSAFLNQRIRWASKADKFDDKRIIAVLSFVYLLNLTLFILPITAFWWPVIWFYWLGALVVKTLIDLRFMVPVAKFFNEQLLLWWLPLMQPIHIAYTVVAGWLGKFGKYQWKGRTVK